MSTTPNGHLKLTIYLRPDQYVWLHALALDEAVERGGGRPDASQLVREMIDHLKPEVEKVLQRKKKRRK
jgi:hypothetical protein